MESFNPEYLRRETWSLIEAACLLNGDDPAGIASMLIADPGFGGRASHIYANLKDATDMGALESFTERTGRIADRRVRPWDAVQWAKAKRYEIPEELLTIPEPQPVAATVAATPVEKPLTTNERNTLLTIIAALCDYSAIDVKGRGAAGQIAKLTDDMGAPVSDDTVRKTLTQIPVALASRKK